jgi:hypothetical protein
LESTQYLFHVTGSGQIADIAFLHNGACAVDMLGNGFYVFPDMRGDGNDPRTLFGPVSANGPGGANSGAACTGDPHATQADDPYVVAPQARLVPTGGMNPLDAGSLAPADTGLDFTVATGSCAASPTASARRQSASRSPTTTRRPTSPATSSRNVVVLPGTLLDFRCRDEPTTACTTRLDCGPGDECMPLVKAVIPSTALDPLPPQILDGKIAFTTTARSAAGAGSPIPPWNHLGTDGSVNQGEVLSTSRDGSRCRARRAIPTSAGRTAAPGTSGSSARASGTRWISAAVPPCARALRE